MTNSSGGGTRIKSGSRGFIRAGSAAVIFSAAFLLPAGRSTQAAVVNAAQSGGAAVLAYADLGNSLGVAGILLWDRPSPQHIITGGIPLPGFGFPPYWIEMAYDAASGDYRQVFVSSYHESPILRMGIGSVMAKATDQLVLLLADGSVEIIDLATKLPVSQFQTAAGYWTLEGIKVADVDGDGIAEILVTTVTDLYVYHADGSVLFSVPGVRGYDIVVGQMDDDPGLEIATYDKIIDVATRSVQWASPIPFGSHLLAFDIDGDGKDELIGSYGSVWGQYFLTAYDVMTHAIRWQTPLGGTGGLVREVPLGAGGRPGILAAQSFSGPMLVCDPANGTVLRTIDARGSYVPDLVASDLDGDGRVELAWATGAETGMADHLHIVDGETGIEKWVNVDFDGPFIGPEIGDLDGDGIDDVVILSTGSDSGYNGGRLVVLDRTLAPRAISEGIGFYQLQDFKVLDVDGDGRAEIVVASEHNLQGVVEIYRFDADNTFHRVWENFDRPEGVHFQSVAVADIDGDGVPEVIAGGSRDFSSSVEVAVYVYDYATRREKWKFNGFNTNRFYVRSLAVLPAVPGRLGRDFAAREENGDVYVLDGFSHAVRAVFRGSFSSLSPLTGGSGVLLLGDTSGMVWTIDRDRTGYFAETPRKVATGRIDGAARLPDKRFVVGFGGRLFLFKDLNDQPIWHSELYGEVFGRRPVQLKGSKPLLLATGSYSVEAFSLPQLKVSGKPLDSGTAGDTGSRLEAGPDASYFREGHAMSPASGSSRLFTDAAVGSKRGTFSPFGACLTVP